MTRPRVALAALALLAAACGPSIQYHRAPDVRLPVGATWAWGAPDHDGLSLRDGALVPADSVSRMISDAIARELTAKGFRRVDAAPQFVVHFHVGQRQVADTVPPRNAPDGVRMPGRWGGYGDPEDIATRTFTWEEGMLIIDALTPDGRIVAWRGVIAGEVPPEAARAPDKAIGEAVRLLLRGFP